MFKFKFLSTSAKCKCKCSQKRCIGIGYLIGEFVVVL